jgi:hypothetical protein
MRQGTTILLAAAHVVVLVAARGDERELYKTPSCAGEIPFLFEPSLI